MTKQELQPKIRFSEFTKDWDNSAFSTVINKSFKGKGIAKKDITSDGQQLCIRYGELYTTYGNVIDIVKSKTNTSIESCVLSKGGELLFPSSGETPEDIATFHSLNSKNIALGGDINAIEFKNGQFSDFYAYYLSSFKKRDVAKYAQGHSVVHLYFSALRNMKIYYPEMQEQEKIAKFLRQVDSLIANLTQQKAKLEEHKKGVMQKIFSQEIRFTDKNAEDYSDWQTIELGKLFKERKERCTDEKMELLSISLSKGVTKYDSSLKKDSSNSDKSKYKIVRKNDIAYNTMRMWQGASGVSNFEGIVSPAYTVVTLQKGSVDFFGYLFKQPNIIHEFYRYSQGLTSDTWNLKFRHFSEVKVHIPQSTEEQRKIASFLQQMDEYIVHKSEEILTLKRWKKGLLQKMFV